MSYYSDARVRAMGPRAYTWTVDGNTVIVTLRDEIAESLDTEDTPFDPEITIPLKYGVCPLCSGKGTVVDPSIDSHGLTREDFDENPGFREDYFSGMYDMKCPECVGLRVVPEIELPPDVQAAVEEWEYEEAAYQRECAMERRFGC